MSKECGQFFLATNKEIPLDGFILNKSDIEIHTGDTIKVDLLHPILVTAHSCLADKLFCRGIALNEMAKGTDVLMMVHPKVEVKM
jgi:hypothetical protein